MGAGSIINAVRALLPYLKQNANCDLNILCGSNEALFDSVETEFAKNGQITSMRSTNKMALYLKASDVFISKPGGLSSTESAAAGVPLVHISPIPGCESRNAEFFCQGGYRRKCGKHRNRAFVGGGKAFRAGKCGRNAQTAESSYQSKCSHGYLQAVGNGSTVMTQNVG